MTPLSRRSFLALLAAGAAAACSNDLAAPGGSSLPIAAPGTTTPPTQPPPKLSGPAFTLGVASGDPLPDRVVLWTRLAPAPLAGGGMPDQDVSVVWEVADDEAFRTVVASGVATASTRWGHSVHVDAGGLTPDTWYWYRFKLGDEVSPLGRTRTAPAADQEPGDATFRFGFASCQEWTNGFYTAYPHLVEEELDLMVWLGDYIYEGGIGSDAAARKHNSPAIETLEHYRNRYALYTGDPNLQAARAAVPWVVLWDDHEVENNYAGLSSKKAVPPELFAARRAIAYQVWWENQPVRMDPPTGPDLRIYRTLGWGAIADFFVLDQRQYRSPQICDSNLDVGNCPARDEPARTLLGTEQRDWFFGELDRTKARWTVIANEVIMAPMPIGSAYNLDQWDGFPVERRQVLDRLARPDLHPLVITGDIHAFGMADLRRDAEAGGEVVAAEFVGGSVTSAFPLGFDASAVVAGAKDIRYADSTRHGYAVMDLTKDEARCRFRAVESVRVVPSPVQTIAEFVVEPGRRGATQVTPTPR